MENINDSPTSHRLSLIQFPRWPSCLSRLYFQSKPFPESISQIQNALFGITMKEVFHWVENLFTRKLWHSFTNFFAKQDKIRYSWGKECIRLSIQYKSYMFLVIFHISRKNITRKGGTYKFRDFWTFLLYKTFLSHQKVSGSYKNSCRKLRVYNFKP